jgi:hypothetical protein
MQAALFGIRQAFVQLCEQGFDDERRCIYAYDAASADRFGTDEVPDLFGQIIDAVLIRIASIPANVQAIERTYDVPFAALGCETLVRAMTEAIIRLTWVLSGQSLDDRVVRGLTDLKNDLAHAKQLHAARRDPRPERSQTQGEALQLAEQNHEQLKSAERILDLPKLQAASSTTLFEEVLDQELPGIGRFHFHETSAIAHARPHGLAACFTFDGRTSPTGYKQHDLGAMPMALLSVVAVQLARQVLADYFGWHLSSFISATKGARTAILRADEALTGWVADQLAKRLAEQAC